MVRQMVKRVGASDLASFGLMWELQVEAEAATVKSIDRLRDKGFTWAEIAAEIGWSRSHLYQWRHRARRDLGVHETGTADSPSEQSLTVIPIGRGREAEHAP